MPDGVEKLLKSYWSLTPKHVRAALANAQVELVVLEKCGHFWDECPDLFYPRVRAFLGLADDP